MPGSSAIPRRVKLHAQIEWNRRIAMRDGVELSADVYHAGGGPHATVLARTPYLKNTAEQQQLAQLYADHGYTFVWMDVRGRGDSDGEFWPWRNEARDGYDTIEWIAGQPWSDGRVVTWGASYLGNVQWLTAAFEKPPHLSAMIVVVPPSDPWEDMPTGMHIPWEICWFRMLDGRVLQHVEQTDWPSIFWHLPLLTMDEAAGFHSPYWRKHLETPITDGSYWDPVRYQRRMTGVDVPVLHVSGWYDDVQRGTTENFTRMTAPGVDAGIRANQSLLMGPWDHRLTMTRERRLGTIDFGAEAELDLRRYEFDWLDGVLGGGAGVPPVRIFVMGQNVWRDEQEWPLARTRWTDYHLASDGSANTRHGDGTLSERPTEGAASDTFVYDPEDPVPFLSDHASSMQIGGPDDYAQIEERTDVLVYTTPTLDADVEVTGPVRAVIHASTSARDTDFTAKLVDVHPDGFCQRICDGLIRLRFRAGYSAPEQLVEPGAVVEVEIDMWSTSHTFLAGHAIRLEVSSSAFPKFNRNLNTGGPLAKETEPIVATNRVWHSADAPSRLILPVIPS